MEAGFFNPPPPPCGTLELYTYALNLAKLFDRDTVFKGHTKDFKIIHSV